MNVLKSLAIALAMYSKLPVPNIEWEEKNMRYAMGFFPIVGVIIGALTLGVGQRFCSLRIVGSFSFQQ